jgi:hypothetical protein
MKTYPSLAVLESMSGIGKDQWIKMQFNRNFSNPYLDSDMDAFLVPNGPCELKDIDTVGNEIALELHETYGNIYVAMSGGIDSEWVAKCFLRQNIPFTPIIYEAEDLMGADTWWAKKWCSEHNITPIIFKEYLFQFVNGLVDISREYICRTPGGPYMMSRLVEYVKDQGGHLVTGAGFPEIFPDPNLSYMQGRFLDNKLMNTDGTVKNHGWLLHEADFMLHKVLEGHPWNFLSWKPDIVLSYISIRNQGTTEFNKANIFNCLPRPKAIGIPDIFWRSRNPIIEKLIRIKNRVGTSEVDFIGTTDQLKAILTTGNINAN